VDDWNEADPEPEQGPTRRKVTLVVVMTILLGLSIVLCCAFIGQVGQLFWLQSTSP